VPAQPVVDALIASAETVLPGDGPLYGAAPEETALLSRWLGKPNTRLGRTASRGRNRTGRPLCCASGLSRRTAAQSAQVPPDERH